MEMENSTPENGEHAADTPKEKRISITLRQPSDLQNGFRVDIESHPPLPHLPESLREQAGRDPMLMGYMVMMSALHQFIQASHGSATAQSRGGIIE
ncbi:hypothetical protein EBZ80_06995 [bacterium]|nr:hypothetical protein [bacterium]